MYGKHLGIFKQEVPTSVDGVSFSMVLLVLMKYSIIKLQRLKLFSHLLWIKMLLMNHGVSETSNYGMNQRKHVQFSTVNVTTRELHLNSALNHQTSKMTTFHHKLDLSRFHHKEELPYMRAPIIMERRLLIPQIKLVSKTLILPLFK